MPEDRVAVIVTTMTRVCAGTVTMPERETRDVLLLRSAAETGPIEKDPRSVDAADLKLTVTVMLSAWVSAPPRRALSVAFKFPASMDEARLDTSIV